MNENARIALLGLGAAGLAFFVFGGFAGMGAGSIGTTDPYDAVPRDSFLVGTVELSELRSSPIYETIFGNGKESKRGGRTEPLVDPKTFGVDKLAETCGFDPLSRVDRLAVAVPESDDKGELGVAAKIRVSRDELERCTGALTKKIETKDVGSFVVVDASTAVAPAARLAYGHGGLLVAGRGEWFDTMLAAADNKKPGIKDAAGHVALRTRLTSVAGWQRPTIVVTAIIPQRIRDRVKGEMGGEVNDSSQNIMAGVLGVSSAGVAVKAAGDGKNVVEAAVELVCDSETACASVEKLLGRLRLEWSKEIGLRLVGLGPLIDSIEVKRDGAHIRVTAGMWADALASSVERVLRFKGRSEARQPAALPAPPPERKPDERITAPR